FFLRATAAEMAHLVAELSQGGEATVTAASFRDRLGTGRKVAIQVLEFFDRAGITARIGDERRVVPAKVGHVGPPPQALTPYNVAGGAGRGEAAAFAMADGSQADLITPDRLRRGDVIRAVLHCDREAYTNQPEVEVLELPVLFGRGDNVWAFSRSLHGPI